LPGQTIPFLARQSFLVPVTCNPYRYTSTHLSHVVLLLPTILLISTNPYLHTNPTEETIINPFLIHPLTITVGLNNLP